MDDHTNLVQENHRTMKKLKHTGEVLLVISK